MRRETTMSEKSLRTRRRRFSKMNRLGYETSIRTFAKFSPARNSSHDCVYLSARNNRKFSFILRRERWRGRDERERESVGSP